MWIKGRRNSSTPIPAGVLQLRALSSSPRLCRFSWSVAAGEQVDAVDLVGAPRNITGL